MQKTLTSREETILSPNEFYYWLYFYYGHHIRVTPIRKSCRLMCYPILFLNIIGTLAISKFGAKLTSLVYYTQSLCLETNNISQNAAGINPFLSKWTWKFYKTKKPSGKSTKTNERASDMYTSEYGWNTMMDIINKWWNKGDCWENSSHWCRMKTTQGL